MKSLIALLKIEYLFTKRSLIAFGLGVFMPIAFFLIFSSINGSDNAPENIMRHFLISMTSFSCLSFAFFAFPISMVEAKENNWEKIIVHSPIPMSKYYLAKVIRILAYFVIAIILVFATGYFIKNVQMPLTDWLVSGMLLTIGSTTFLGIGLAISMISSKETMSAVSNIIYLGLAMLGGLWMPVSIFPSWLQNISKLTPTYHLAELANKYIDKHTFATESFMILTAYAVLFVAVSLVIARRKRVR
ncbi:ABC transporter permease [Actinomyces sp. zg-332]|uniref:ABC transporter permease n=1 Tax=Actinomyces sp. zg-332 TaxID=2708340 RepID=UPI00141FD9A6|nr:ABC transporter permease [Actinomyces sp. zg-332]QPK93611.1 ABC transporter permease [Actinomyces sp. zg-332]